MSDVLESIAQRTAESLAHDLAQVFGISFENAGCIVDGVRAVAANEVMLARPEILRAAGVLVK